MIRNATQDDIPAMLALGRAMHSESTHKFARFSWSDEKVATLIRWLIDSEDGYAVVVDVDGRLAGGFLGTVMEQFFSYERIAQDFALFVSADARGAMMGRALIKAFAEWGRGKGVPVEIGVSTGVQVEATCKLLEASGFRRFGYLYELDEEA